MNGFRKIYSLLVLASLVCYSSLAQAETRIFRLENTEGCSIDIEVMELSKVVIKIENSKGKKQSLKARLNLIGLSGNSLLDISANVAMSLRDFVVSPHNYHDDESLFVATLGKKVLCDNLKQVQK